MTEAKRAFAWHNTGQASIDNQAAAIETYRETLPELKLLVRLRLKSISFLRVQRDRKQKRNTRRRKCPALQLLPLRVLPVAVETLH